MSLRDVFRRKKPDPVADLQAELKADIPGLTRPSPTPEITKVMGEKRYSSLDANCIAQGPLTLLAYGWLMQTNKGNFFMVYQGFFGGVFSGAAQIQAVDSENAVKYYDHLAFQIVPYEQVFNTKVVDA